MSPTENWHVRKIIVIAVIVAVCTGVISGLTFLLTPSEIREYRVELNDHGIYRVVAVVRYGQDFISYHTTDGKEAIEIAGELNDSLKKDDNGGPPHVKPTARKGMRGAQAAEIDKGGLVR